MRPIFYYIFYVELFGREPVKMFFNGAMLGFRGTLFDHVISFNKSWASS